VWRGEARIRSVLVNSDFREERRERADREASRVTFFFFSS